MPWYTHRPGADPVIGHGDVGPWNIVSRDGIPVAFIDWEFAGPVDRLDEVAEAIRLNCQLHGEDVAALHHLSDAHARAGQVRLFADAYGLDAQQLAVMVDRMIEAAVRGCANDCDEAAVTPEFLGPHPMVWGMAWQVRGRGGSLTTPTCSSEPLAGQSPSSSSSFLFTTIDRWRPCRDGPCFHPVLGVQGHRRRQDSSSLCDAGLERASYSGHPCPDLVFHHVAGL